MKHNTEPGRPYVKWALLATPGITPPSQEPPAEEPQQPAPLREPSSPEAPPTIPNEETPFRWSPQMKVA